MRKQLVSLLTVVEIIKDEKYLAEQIFNVNEVELFWKWMPARGKSY